MMGEPWEIAGPGMRAQMTLPHQAVFHARALFEKFGIFDGDLQIAGDYKLVMQSMKTATPVYLGDIVVADQSAGGKSSLRKNRSAALWEIRKVQAELGYPMTLSWLWIYAKGLVWGGLSRIRSFD